MKTFKISVLAFMATFTGASFSACSNETEEVLGQDTEIRLTSEITPSRVTSLDYQSTQIVAGQQVGVTIANAKAEHNNIAWTVGADGALTNTGAPLYYTNKTATITAYHPYNQAWKGTSNYSFSVNTDQSIELNYRNSDLLWATASSSKTANAVALTFKHKLAKINVTLVPEEEGINLSGATISICGTNIATNFNPSTGALSAATANVQEIKAGVTTATAKTASAIIVPQTIAASTPFIKVTLGNKTFYHKLSTEKEFVSGKSYSYTLTVKEKKVEVDTEGDIKDWEDEEITGDADEDTTPYLTFTADAEQTLTMSKAVETLEYSVNNGVWQTLGATPVTFGDTYGTLRLRGMSETGTATEIDPETAPKISFGNNTKVRCEGDIRTLVNYKNFEHADCSRARFIALFGFCTQLTSAPSLPSEVLADACYMHMFWGCTSLTEAPILPAKTLANSCYAYMFGRCSSLIKAPDLPAITLTNACYSNMFYDCSSLSQAPELLATTDGGNSYYNMFYGCNSLNYLKVMLTSAPSNGNVDILKGLASTGTVVVNRAATWVNQYNIPSDWTIKYEGESSWTGDNTPYLTFSSDSKQTLEINVKVSSLEDARDHYTTIEYSVDGSVWQDLYYRVVTFGGVTGDLKLRSKNPYGTTKAEVRMDGSSPDYHYIGGSGYDNNMTYFISQVTIEFGTESKVSCTGDIRTLVDYENYETTDCSNARFRYLFDNATVLSSAPELPIKTLSSFCYEGMFNNCTSLTTAPKLPAMNLGLQCYHSMFRNCSSLVAAPQLPATTLADGCYINMFYGCTSLTTPPELPAVALARSCYSYMFQYCSNLRSAPKLNATMLAPHCYASMFSSCKSLTTAPDLPATTLTERCYSQMFISCSSLTYIKMMATDISAEQCLQSWLSGSSTGTFVKNVNATWDESDVIPKGWTVTTTN